MTTIAYVANADSHDISVFSVDAATGDLHEIERHGVGGKVMPLAASPDGRFLHASIRSEPHRVLTLAIDAASGRLRETGSAPLPASMAWISTDRSGRYLLSASYGDSLVAVSPIGVDGVVGAAQQVVSTPANAHSIRVDAANRHAYAPCLGGGVVRQWHFDAATGRLRDNAPAEWTARQGAGPRHLAFHPTLPFAYLINELDASVDVLAIDPATGALAGVQTASAWPSGGAGAPWAADIHISGDGRFLFASERRTSTIASFAIDGASGGLSALATTETEREPRGFGIAPGGLVLVAGQASDAVSRYRIDATSGAVRLLGSTPAGKNPNWVEIVEPGVSGTRPD